MTPSKHIKELELILKTSTPDYRRCIGNYFSYHRKLKQNTRRVIVKALRQAREEEREVKKMRWKRQATGKWNWIGYHINKLDENKYWLGKTPYGWDTSVGIGIFPDMETAKYVAYLINKK